MWTNISGNNLLVGSVTARSGKAETAFIKINSSSTNRNYVFDGDINHESQVKKVVGMALPNAGDYLCTSGSYSRVRCNVRLGTGINWSMTNGFTGATIYPQGSKMYSTDGGWILAGGDSGGPVFKNTNGNTQALAYGTMSIAWNEVSCPTWTGNPTECFTDGAIGLAYTMYQTNNVTFSW